MTDHRAADHSSSPHTATVPSTPSRKKILILITKSNWGGAQRYVFDLATALKDRHDVVVGLGGNGTLFEKLQAAGVRTISLPFLTRNVHAFKDIATFFGIIRLIRKERPDVLHVNSSKIGGLGGLAGRLTGVPRIIFTAHGWAFNEKRPAWQRGIIACAHWCTIVLAHRVIAVSHKMLRDVAWMPFVQHKITVIWNGVPTVSPMAHSEARAHLISLLSPDMQAHIREKNPYFCGAISELHMNKGLDFLIEAVPLIRERTAAPFVFFIAGDGELRETLRAHIKAAGVEDVVLFAGHVSNAAHYVSGFDAFIMPSRTEGLPYAILEAGLAGLPVIASNIGGIPEVIRQLENGILVRTGDIKDIADAVIFVMQEKAKAAALGAALHERIITHFSLKGMVEKTEELYLGK